MSSTDEEGGFADNPLSRAGIALFVVGGIFLVGVLLLIGINQIFPLRPQTLALRFLLPASLAEVAGRFEAVDPGTWHRQHTVALALIVLLYAIGPIALARSIRGIASRDLAQESAGASWRAALLLALGSGLTFFAILGPLIAVPAAFVGAYQMQRSIEQRLDRSLLAGDMEMMALKAQAIYHRSSDPQTAWAGGGETPSLSIGEISVEKPVLEALLSDRQKDERSYFVLSVTKTDTILIYGRRGHEGITFDRTAVLQACGNGDAPPGITVTPNSWRWNFG